MALLDVNVVKEAVRLSLPTIRETLKAYTWGPKGVAIVVDAKGLEAPYLHVMEELGPEEEWAIKWGMKSNFRQIALNKAAIARRYGTTSWHVVSQSPWMLEEGDFFYRGGVAEDTDLAVGISGSHGEVDEAMAWGVWNCIAGLCNLKISEFRAAGLNRLP